MSETEVDLLEELASLPTFHHQVVSPNGGDVAVYYDGSGRNELHLLDTDTGELRQVSDGEVPRNARWPVDWSADGERVFFHLDDDGNEQNDLWAIDRDGDVESVLEFDGQVVLHDVGEDGETLLVGSTAGGQMNLYRHDTATGETTRITDYERAVHAAALSPACDRVAYATNESDDYDNLDVYVADVDGGDPRNLEIGETGAEVAPVAFTPDGTGLLVADNTENFSRAGVYDLETEAVTWYGDLSAEEQPVGFLPDGDRFLATRVRDAATVPLVYDVETGESRAFDLPAGDATLPGGDGAIIDDDTVLVAHETSARRPELLAYDLTADDYETLLEAEYGELDPEQFVEAEVFRFESHDGLDIEALLFDSGERPSPAIVNPHGGPRARDSLSFDLYTQFLLARGYSVLKVNYRGSTGRGREFVERLYDDWGGGEQADVAEGTKLLREKDWIDEERLAVFGGSYGGYSAYWQMVRYPELYAAGVAWIGVTDLEDMFENTMPHYRTELMEKYLGTPEENPDLYRERSPVTHVENLQSPLLMVHGVNDRRVPVSQARIFRDALDEAGFVEGEDGDYEYVELGEEGHASSDIEQKIRMLRILDDFLDRRL